MKNENKRKFLKYKWEFKFFFYSTASKVNFTLITGDTNNHEDQIKQVKSGGQGIVVATPGRLINLLKASSDILDECFLIDFVEVPSLASIFSTLELKYIFEKADDGCVINVAGQCGPKVKAIEHHEKSLSNNSTSMEPSSEDKA